MRRSSSRVIALALAAGVVLSACASTDRSAAPAEQEVVTEQVTESVEELANEPEVAAEADQDLGSDSDADAPSEGEATPDEAEANDPAGRVGGSWGPTGYCVEPLYRCTSIEFRNNLGTWVKLKADGNEQGKFDGGLNPGATKVVTGYVGSWGVPDIDGRLFYSDFVARNPQIGYPCVGMDYYSSARKQWYVAKKSCRGLAEGESTTFYQVTGTAKAVVKREEDTVNMVRFTIDLSMG